MIPQRRKHARIYISKKHLLFPFLIALLPFLFLLLFSEFAHITQAVLFYDVFISCLRMLVAYIASVIFAWVCAVLFYRGKRAAVALPIFDLLQSFPTSAALPLAVILWGATDFTIIFFLMLQIVWPIFFSLISSLKLVKHEWEEVVQISGMRGWAYLKNFLMPISIPALITGSIIGLGDGWEGLVAVEIIVGRNTGLGSFFQHFSNNTPITIFGILGFLIIVFSINKLLWLPLLEWSHRLMEE